MNAIFFVLFMCGKPAYFMAAAGDAYAVEPIATMYAEGEYSEALRTALRDAHEDRRVLRIDLDKLTGHVCL